MADKRGGSLGDVQPIDPLTGRMNMNFIELVTDPGSTLNYGPIQRMTPLDAFRPPQQILFRIGIKNPVVDDNWFTSVSLKLWWAWPNKEFRAPGTPTGRPALEIPPGSGWAPIDQQTFLAGPNAGVENNRYIWTPSTKRLDTTPYDSAPLPIPIQPNSFSVIEDDVLYFVMPDPTDPNVIAAFPSPQVISRWDTFLYPAMGYALGLTWDATFQIPELRITPEISLQWMAGTWGDSIIDESTG